MSQNVGIIDDIRGFRAPLPNFLFDKPRLITVPVAISSKYPSTAISHFKQPLHAQDDRRRDGVHGVMQPSD
jgi:hypothetical protein